MKRFAECVENDKDFSEKFTFAMKAKNIDEVIRLAAEKGFTLTRENFAFQGKRELDTEELEHENLNMLPVECLYTEAK